MTDKKTDKLFHKAISAVKAKKGSGRALGIKTRTINIYSFDELSAKAKEVARNWFREASANSASPPATAYHVRLDATGKVVRLTDRSIGEVVSRDGKMQPRTRLG